MKWEGVSPSGSHKPNTALAQAYYHQKEGKERLTTETGAGQWGSALSFAASIFDMQCTVYMGRGDYEQKPFRKSLMRAWGAECIPSPSTRTQVGKDLLARNPDHKGSLMISISEAIWDAMHTKNTGYSIGSLTNNVLIHQTVIGLEAQQQFKQIDDYPDVVIGCVGGGSNFGGVSFPFIGEKLRGERPDLEIIASEPASCPTMTKGVFAYDFGDSSGLTPLIKMLTLGHDFMPPAIYAGGLRLHCISPIVSKLVMDKTVRAVAYNQVPVFDAATLFARSEGYVVAPETAHAVKAVIEAARECKRTKEAKTILFNGSGHGNFDLNAYDRYFDGKLENYPYPAAMAKETSRRLPKVV
jgi:tryptophan synthase beta chain